MLKKIIKSFIPEKIILQYHAVQNFLAAQYYGNPSKKLKVIGITGTKGKSTSANFVWSVLQTNNIKCGLVGTANIRIGDREEMNMSHMTMPNGWLMQKYFADMVKENCEAVVIEVSSEGIKQHRNDAIYFFAGMFTNLSPEHLPSHNNSFEEYKNTKKKFFHQLHQQKAEVIIVNADNEYSHEFLEEDIKNKFLVSLQNANKLKNKDTLDIKKQFNASIITMTSDKTFFSVGDEKYSIFLGGDKNVENALLAIAMGKYLGLSANEIQNGFDALKIIPGRMEKIDEGQNFTVFVDYAHEEKSMTFIATLGQGIIENYKKENPNAKPEEIPRSLILLGGEGGGRDKRKLPIMGKIVGEKADIVMVSNVDPYEDDPTPICEEIAIAAEKYGKIRNKNLFVIEDRRKGIAKIFQLARKNDIVFITGKGSEQTLTINGKAHKWDDRVVVAEELQKSIH